MDLMAYALVSSETDLPRRFVRLWNEVLIPLSKKATKRTREVRYLLHIPDNFNCDGTTASTAALLRPIR